MLRILAASQFFVVAPCNEMEEIANVFYGTGINTVAITGKNTLVTNVSLVRK